MNNTWFAGLSLKTSIKIINKIIKKFLTMIVKHDILNI
nr:MAG TPA: hypothetical protein [Caudoviricetes sp.]